MTARRIGAYELGPLLGRGAMGAVYRARHVELAGVERALKVLAFDASGEQLRRFEREATALARVDHPAVVRVHEAGQAGGQPYLVMDLVAGEPLDRALKAGRPPLPRALALAAGLARGVAAMHAAGVVHRDLKPANVLVREDGAPVIVDLGLALVPDRDERLTRTGALLGTPLYMAPEQLVGLPAGAPADVYALGLLAFELATGRAAVPPVDGLPALLDEVVHHDRPTARSVDPTLPAALDALLGPALRRDPARRPDAASLAAGLEALAAGAPLSAAPDATLRALVAGAALAVALLVAAVAARGPGRDASPAPAPTPAAPDAPAPAPRRASEPDPAAARQLRRLQREPDPAERAAGARDWLERWPDEPDRPALEELLRRANAQVPLALPARSGTQYARFLDDRTVITSSLGGLDLFDAETGAERGVLWEQALSGPLVVVPGGPVLAVSGPRILPVSRDGRPGEVIVAPSDVGCLAVSGDGRLLLSGHEDHVARARALPDGRLIAELRGHGHALHSVALTRDGALAATGTGLPGEVLASADNAVRIWDLAGGGRLLREQPLDSRVDALVFVARGGALELLAGTSGGRLYRLDPAGQGAPQEVLGSGPRGQVDARGALRARAHTGGVHALAASPDGRRAWTVSSGVLKTDNEVRAWDLEALTERYGVFERSNGMHMIDVSPDGRRIVTSSFGGIEVWRTD